MKWKIGQQKIENQVVLAPMADISDHTYRSIIKTMNCGLLETEMIHTNAILQPYPKIQKMMKITEDEKPISMQLLGSQPETFKKASQYIEENIKPSIIDINMGCPVEKIAQKAKAGSGLLRKPELISEIITTVTDTVNIPVTIKIRSGWDHNSINAVQIAKIAEESGASGITVHPRTKTQGYSGKSDWNIIRQVKENVDIPVIGNGDIWTCYDAEKMINETGCDAVMIGRGALGNPWLIKECIDYLDHNKKPQQVTAQDKINMIKKHTELLLKEEDETIAIIKIRKHASYYIKKLPFNAIIKEKIFQTNTKKELYTLLDNYLKSIEKREKLRE